MAALAFLCLLRLTAAGARAREKGASDEPAALPGAGSSLLVYVREGCPHCAEAKVFLDGLRVSWPDLTVVYRPVDPDPAARDELMRWTRTAGIWPPGRAHVRVARGGDPGFR